MLSAKKAREFTDVFSSVKKGLKSNEVRRMTDYQRNPLLLQMLSISIHQAIVDGFDSCITYLTPDQLCNQVLRSHGYKVEQEKEDDIVFYVISWGDADRD